MSSMSTNYSPSQLFYRTVEYKNITFTVWDVGGQQGLRPIWRHVKFLCIILPLSDNVPLQYYQDTQGLIFVVDCSDRERIREASEELHQMLADNTLRVNVLLVFANKQDLPNAMTPAEITEKMGLDTIKNRKWFVQSSCATEGQGLLEVLQNLILFITIQGPGMACHQLTLIFCCIF